MRTLWAGLRWAAFFAAAQPCWAADDGPFLIWMLQSPDNRPCMMFEVNRAQPGAPPQFVWYGFYNGTPGYSEAVLLLTGAKINARNVLVTTSDGSRCGGVQEVSRVILQ